MKKTLYLKLLFSYLVFGLLGFILVSTFSSSTLYRYLLKREASTIYNEANALAKNFSQQYNDQAADLNSMNAQFDAISTYLKSYIWVMDKNGTITYDTSANKRIGQTVANFDPTITSTAQTPVVSDYYQSFEEPVLSALAPIIRRYNISGYVAIHMPVSVIDQLQYDLLNIVYFTLILLFILSLILLAAFHVAIYRPIQKITVAADAYASGNLKYKLEVCSNDELGYLAATLNYMAMELANTEEYQRKFIANVSHDFRSPLTSIKGYIEAMLDGTIPPENQNKYLNIVISETERLNKLTESMLTLNSLSKKGTYLNIVDFDINRVIKDTCATFEGTCQIKNIILDLTFSEKSLLVRADLGKIQQVLYNLIDNAIKFSHPDATIWIEVYDRHEKVFISVKDSGIGIPKDSIKKIWERFYKTDLSRGKDKKGTGLGLSITKEIIQAHNENIDVISTEGVGTEFIFTLPKAVN